MLCLDINCEHLAKEDYRCTKVDPVERKYYIDCGWCHYIRKGSPPKIKIRKKKEWEVKEDE